MDRIDQLERKLHDLEKRVAKLEKEKTSKSVSLPNISGLQKLLVQNISKIKPQDLIILILYSTPKQTKEQIKNKFLSLGSTKKMLNWFNGGNFKQRLIDSGLVLEDDNNTYSLTEGKGKQKVFSIIEKLES